MTDALLITGGRQRAGALSLDEWFHYEAALIVRVDLDSGASDVVVEHISPADCVPQENPSVVFKSASVAGGQLIVPTQTEVLRYDISTFEQVGRWTHPWLNDVHHAVPLASGGMWVANTGLDQILEVNRHGEIVREWNLGEAPTWDRFDANVDYRQIATTKPHHCHPNFVFSLDGDPWVTRFEQRDAVSLTALDDRMAIEQERPHDGVQYEGHVYFTTVDGCVVVFEATTRKRVALYDINTIFGDDRPLGWCRGIHVVDDHLVWVGFSRLRPTRFRETLSWVKHGFSKVGTYAMSPTRIALVDLDRKRVVREVNLESCGLNAIFSVLSAP